VAQHGANDIAVGDEEDALSVASAERAHHRLDNAALSAVQVAGEFAEVKFLNIIPDIGRTFVAPFPVKPAADSPAEEEDD